MLNSLTKIVKIATLYAPLTHSKDGRENLKITGCKAAINAVFLCPSKINTGLCRFNNAMTGRCRQLSSWPIPVFGILTLLRSVTHSVRRIVTALYSNTGQKLMHTYTQKLTNNVRQNHLVSFFSVTLPNRATIAKHLTFTEALQLKNKLSNTCFIRFEKMGVPA